MVKDLKTKFDYPIAGSLRIGEKNEKNIPQKLDYFTVHEDTHTIPEVVEQFKTLYDKPKELTIKFLTDDPLEVSYVRYGKSGLLCKGDGEIANCKSEKDWVECECSKDCSYRGKECKLTGRLLFLVKGINIGGLWRLQTQSYNTIQNFLATLNFLKCMGVNITEKEFRLATEEKKSIVDGKVNKYTTISLKMIENSSKVKSNDSKTNTIPEDNKTEEKNKKVANKKEKSKEKEETKSDSKVVQIEEKKENTTDEIDYEKCLTLVEIKDITKGEKIAKQATFCTMKDEIVNVLLHPDIVDEVCKWEVASTILPINIYEQNNYKILKEFKEIEIIKKAV